MKLRAILLGTAVALGSAGAANAAITTPTGWYVSLGAGANWIEDGKQSSGSSGIPSTFFNDEWESGYAITGTVGYDFGSHWRAEFEVAFRDNDIKRFCFTSTPACGNSGTGLWELSQMVNVLYDIPLGGNFSAAVGAGIGGNLVVITNEGGGVVDYDDYVLAGQLLAQLGYQFSERWQAYAGYSYMFMDNPEFEGGPQNRPTGLEKTDHTLMIGIRFDLQRDGAPPPPPAPPAAPPKSPKQFIVFFGFNKSNLTPEAGRVVADAAAAAKEYGSASIMVVGHTDTVGSAKYNNALSMRRSQSVKDGLAASGIPASAISTGGRGESELMVQTGDGVKEPQNRRATIDLN